MRTDYDLKLLKGRGYMYFSPQSGPLKLDGEQFGDDFWSYENGLLLGRVILHELGHVFGIAHHGPQDGVMAADFPEKIVSKWYRKYEFAKRPFNLEIFKFDQRTYDSCVDDHETNLLGRKLGFDAEWKCVSIRFNNIDLSIYVKQTRTSSSWVMAGSTSLRCEDRCGKDSIYPITMQLSEHQKVFDWSRPRRLSIMGPSGTMRHVQAKLKNQISGKWLNLLIELAPARFNLSIVKSDGQIDFGVAKELF